MSAINSLFKKLFLLLSIFLGSFSSFAQRIDSLSVKMDYHQYFLGDTIDIEAKMFNYTAASNASTLHLWIEEIKTGKKWHYRYPLLNGELNSSLIINNTIKDGIYAFNFQLQKSFFNLSGAVKNASQKDNSLNYVLITKNMQTIADAVGLNQDKSFKLGRLLFQDSAFIVFSKPKHNRNDLVINISTPLDSAFIPSSTITRFVSIGNVNDSSKRLVLQSTYSFNEDGQLYKTILPEVVVKAKAKKQIDDFEKENVTGFFAGVDATVIDGLESSEIANAQDLFSYLTGKIAGLSQQWGENGLPQLKWRNRRTEIFINEIKSEEDLLLDINPADIAMIRVYQPGTQISTSNSDGGTIAIYTKTGNYKKSSNTSYSFFINGYNGLDSVWK